MVYIVELCNEDFCTFVGVFSTFDSAVDAARKIHEYIKSKINDIRSLGGVYRRAKVPEFRINEKTSVLGRKYWKVELEKIGSFAYTWLEISEVEIDHLDMKRISAVLGV